MKTDWLPNLAKTTFLVVFCLIAGLSFAVFLDVGRPVHPSKAPDWCEANAVVCIIWEWQTLIAGTAALFGAGWTIRKIQKQIDLTRWEHGQNEIKRLDAEIRKFESDVFVLGSEVSAIDKFATGLNWNDTTEKIITKKLGNFSSLQNIVARFQFDPTIGTKSISSAREALRGRMSVASQRLSEGKETIQDLAVRPPENPHADTKGDGQERVNEFAKAVFATQAPEIWQDAFSQVNDARQEYLDALSNRITSIITQYGQVD